MRKHGATLRRIARLDVARLTFLVASSTALVLVGCTTRTELGSLAESSLEKARVIYLAEEHSDSAHHKFQQGVLRFLHQRRRSLAVGMEMIDVLQQRALDDYLAGKMSWREFARQTGFDRGWGKTSPAYQQILEWCRRNSVPVIGLNAPRSITRNLAQQRKLTAAEARLVPNFPAPAGGFRKFQAAMAGHPGGRSLRRYYEVQRAWDTTMAGRILAWLSNHPGTLVVLLGQFHADPKTGVPWYVAQRSNAAQLILFPRNKGEPR